MIYNDELLILNIREPARLSLDLRKRERVEGEPFPHAAD